METDWLVEATDFERMALYWERAEQSEMRRHAERSDFRWHWKQESQGQVIECGEIGGLPIIVTVFWAVLTQKNRTIRVAFWNCCSRVSDYDLITKQLTLEFPKARTTDAMNFHLVF